MKKLVLMLIAALGIALTGCSTFDSEPVKPKIIGTGNLQYEVKSGTFFVVVDSTQYTVTSITIPDHNPRSLSNTQNVEPIEGMLVTVFTSPRMKGIQAVTGKQSVKQIEEMYQSSANTIQIFFLFCMIFGFVLLCLKAITTQRTKEVPVINADV